MAEDDEQVLVAANPSTGNGLTQYRDEVWVHSSCCNYYVMRRHGTEEWFCRSCTQPLDYQPHSSEPISSEMFYVTLDPDAKITSTTELRKFIQMWTGISEFNLEISWP